MTPTAVSKRLPLHPFPRASQREREERGQILLHGCGLVRGGRAHLFLAPSGGGKSTLAALSAGKAACLSDEHLLLDTGRLRLSAPPCCPSPEFPDGVTLVAAFILRQTPALEIAPADPGALLSVLVRELYPSSWDDPVHANALLGRLGTAAERLPAFTLGFALSTAPTALWNGIDKATRN